MFPARKCLLMIAAIVVICGAQQLAQAEPLVLSLQSNSLTGVAGGSVTFLASAFNSGANADSIFSITLGNPTGVVSTNPSSSFFVNWVFQPVASGDTRGPLELFIVSIPVGTPDGSYSGTVNLGYVSDFDNFSTNTVNWTVRVGSGPAPVPEPTTMLLLGTGLVGIAAKVRKRRKAI